MPELPEVESARRLVDLHGLGHTIVTANALDDDKILQGGLTSSSLELALRESSITSTGRHGKYMWLNLSSSSVLILHFGMTGSIVVRKGGVATAMEYKSFKVDTDNWPPRFTKLEFELENGTCLAFTDSRRFGKLWLLKSCNPEGVRSHPPLDKLGWDPLEGPCPPAVWREQLGQTRRAIKAVLLDQEVLAGVGNWIADEVLYQCRLHPDQAANSLEDDESTRLYHKVIDVCRVACQANADAEDFPPDWLFHYRWTGKKASRDFHGDTIAFETIGGRTSAFVPSRQKKRPSPPRTKTTGPTKKRPPTPPPPPSQSVSSPPKRKRSLRSPQGSAPPPQKLL